MNDPRRRRGVRPPPARRTGGVSRADTEIGFRAVALPGMDDGRDGCGADTLHVERRREPAARVRQRPGVDTPPTPVPRDERHFVTLAQLASSGESAGRRVMRNPVRLSDGREITWEELSAGLPIVAVFIKDGCPCSIEFEPVFHRIARACSCACSSWALSMAQSMWRRSYAAANDVPYPLLADPERALIHDVAAKNAAYVALVSADGVIESMWPGCSAEMMQDLCRKIAACTGIEEQTVDFSGMPGPLTTGCPFRE